MLVQYPTNKQFIKASQNTIYCVLLAFFLLELVIFLRNKLKFIVKSVIINYQLKIFSKGVRALTESANKMYVKFEEWLHKQPYWLRDAAWRIYNAKPIEDAQIEEYVDMCIKQTKKESVDFKELKSQATLPNTIEEQLSILKIFDICGVNALDSKAQLSFEEKGVTVIYGANGTGKSSFMRMFKRVSGTPYADTIQANVFEKNGPDKPECKIDVSQNGESKTITCDLSKEEKHPILASCDVFDTKISGAYVTSTNKVSYEPFVFSVLTELANTAERIKSKIVSRKKALEKITIEVPSSICSFSDIQWVKSIEYDTAFDDKYLNWTDQQANRLSEITVILNREFIDQKIKTISERLGEVAQILEDLETAQKIYNKRDIQEVYKEYLGAKEAHALSQKMFSESATENDNCSVGVMAWRQLWKHAKQYYVSTLQPKTGIEYACSGSICPLCNQQLSDDALKRFSSIDNYVNGQCSENLEKAEKEIFDLCKSLAQRDFNLNRVEHFLDKYTEEFSLKATFDFYGKSIELPDIKTADECYISLQKIDVDTAVKELNSVKTSLQEEHKKLTDTLNDKAQEILRSELENLECHKWIVDNQENIKTVISNKAEMKVLDDSLTLVKTNRITSQSNDLADILITESYIERFTAELKRMAPRLKVQLEKAPSTKGKSPYRIKLITDETSAKPEDILSEGEQRIVALAAFFADATGRDALSPVIIDDPISSLDCNYEEYATKRIVEMAQTRQVIVFTHRLSLLVGLSTCCSKASVAFKECHIRAGIQYKGLPDFEDLYHGKIKNQLNGILNTIAQIKKKDENSEDYQNAIDAVHKKFRILVERSVEDVLILSTVRRFDKQIRTQGIIKKLANIKVEDCEIIESMMTKYSYFEHSQPQDSATVIVDIEDLQKDIEAFRDWVTEYNKRMGVN